MDKLASTVKFYSAVECWTFMPDTLADLARLTKFVQLSMVIYMNDMDYD